MPTLHRLFCTAVATAVFAQPTRPKGSLFIVGGGTQPPEFAERFVALAGGPGKAKIAVIALASSEPAATGAEKAEQLRGLGAEVVVLNPLPAEAMSPASAKSVEDMTGIWFTGGDQTRITSALVGTPFAAALRARYRAGAVIGGTSAGAAIMTDSMITGNQRRADSLGYYGDDFPAVVRGSIEIVPGLGFLSGAIADQHFVVRQRHNRLLSVVLERPSLLGVGIDEGTAVVVGADGRWNVIGLGSVMIYDARRASISPERLSSENRELLGARGVSLHVLPAGSIFDPQLGVIRVGTP